METLPVKIDLPQSETALQLLRKPFEPHLISSLPKPTAQQTADVKANFKVGARCSICGGWHHPKVVHLDYVGHAALTDRLLDVDILWNWAPISTNENGLPLIVDGGMWIELTVCGMTRLGYGDAQGKSGHNAIKEIIGDCLRNAGMRFGMALELWHKGDLHLTEDGNTDVEKIPAEKIVRGIKWFVAEKRTADDLESWLNQHTLSIELLSDKEQKTIKEGTIKAIDKLLALEEETQSQEKRSCLSGGIPISKQDCDKCPDKKCPGFNECTKIDQGKK